MILDLPDPVFEHLKNTLTWAALWDIKCNASKNQAVYDQLLPYFLDEPDADLKVT